MGVQEALSSCEYLNWAHYHDIDLQFSYLQSDLTQCDSLTVAYYNFVLDLDESLNYLAANQFLQKLLDQLKSVTGHLHFKNTFFYKNFRQNRHEAHSLDEALGAAADNQPKYFFYVTEQVYMRLLLSGLMGKANRQQYPQVFQTAPTPSLHFAIEVV